MYVALPLVATLAIALSAPAHAAPTDQKVVLDILQRKTQEIQRYAYEDTLTLLKKHCGSAKGVPTPQCEAAVTYGLEVLGSLRSGTPNVSEALRTAARGVITVCTPGTQVPATDVDAASHDDGSASGEGGADGAARQWPGQPWEWARSRSAARVAPRSRTFAQGRAGGGGGASRPEAGAIRRAPHSR
jgi:hypothetical protein